MYKRDLKKLQKKHMEKELDILSKIEGLILESENMKELMLNPLHLTYGIEQKKAI